MRSLVLALLVFWVAAAAVAQSDYDEWRRQQDRSWNDFRDDVTARYDAWERELAQQYADYVAAASRYWGQDHAAFSTKKEWVAYDGDFQARRRVDFATGTARVEVLVDPETARDEKAVQRELAQQVTRLVTDHGIDDPFAAKTETPEDEAVLTGQLATAGGQPVTGRNAENFAREVVQERPLERETVAGEDGTERVAVAVTIPLVPDHIRVRASRFRDLVDANADRYALDPRLVFAVIHTESWFNPRARSDAPAFGLMQLVPRSGAREAFQHVHGRDEVVTAEYLYRPENNVELGAAYLLILMERYFAGVKDDRSRMYCAIAGYNTGPGNVARAFTGKKRLGPAIERINRLSCDQVLARLERDLPYQETRDYVAKVTERMPVYEEWR